MSETTAGEIEIVGFDEETLKVSMVEANQSGKRTRKNVPFSRIVERKLRGGLQLDCPEKSLIFAIIALAVNDAFTVATKSATKENISEIRNNRESAFAYFTSSEFAKHCGWLGCEPEFLTRTINQAKAEIRKRVKECQEAA